MDFFLFVAGLVAGFVDSIAGGGGLITLPSIALAVGPGALAIGTNKMAGSAAAVVALLKYRHAISSSQRGMFWKYIVLAGVGAVIGTLIGPLVPPQGFRWVLLVTCPLMLALTLFKQVWTESLHVPHKPHRPLALFLGFIAGLYDGAWGPGGGTFYFLILFLFARTSTVMSLYGAKFANSISALVGLTSYSFSGNVNWRAGVFVMLGAGAGAFVGARVAATWTQSIVRPLLAVISIALMLKVFLTH